MSYLFISVCFCTGICWLNCALTYYESWHFVNYFDMFGLVMFVIAGPFLWAGLLYYTGKEWFKAEIDGEWKA